MKIRVCRFAGSAMLLLLVAVVAKAQNCSSSITACGCTISSAGTYAVNADLTASQGLTTRSGCIDVNVNNVKLLTNGHNITGAGTGTGIGINLLSGKQTIFLSAAGPQETYTTLSGWQYGLESQATNVIAEGFLFIGNTTGVLLKGARNNNIGCFESDSNSVYGVWIRGGSGNQIEYGEVWENKVAGVYIGCSATGPSGPACSGGTSSGNYIFEVWSNPSGVPPQSYGIAIELGGTQNWIVDNWFYGNTVDDLFDGNANGVDVWHSNKFVTANQSFLQ
jgi:hypothetical protein